jgi:hypothetical protein
MNLMMLPINLCLIFVNLVFCQQHMKIKIIYGTAQVLEPALKQNVEKSTKSCMGNGQHLHCTCLDMIFHLETMTQMVLYSLLMTSLFNFNRDIYASTCPYNRFTL